MDEIFTNIKERVIEFAKYQGVSLEKFFSEIGMSYGNFKGNSKKTPLNSQAIADIFTKYPNLNLEWLLTGNGPMLKAQQQGDGNTNVGNHNKIATHGSTIMEAPSSPSGSDQERIKFLEEQVKFYKEKIAFLEDQMKKK